MFSCYYSRFGICAKLPIPSTWKLRLLGPYSCVWIYSNHIQTICIYRSNFVPFRFLFICCGQKQSSYCFPHTTAIIISDCCLLFVITDKITNSFSSSPHLRLRLWWPMLLFMFEVHWNSMSVRYQSHLIVHYVQISTYICSCAQAFLPQINNASIPRDNVVWNILLMYIWCLLNDYDR